MERPQGSNWSAGGVPNGLMEGNMDKVDWEIVRADIAMEKARLKANGDWAKWEEFQAQTRWMHETYAAPAHGFGQAARARSRRSGLAGFSVAG